MLKFCKIIFLFIIVWFSSCSNQFENIERAQYGHQFAREFCIVIRNKYHLSCSGSGGGYYRGKIQCINIDFSTNEPFELESARCLMRNIVSELKEVANRNKESLIYFHNQEFSYDSVHFMLKFDKDNERAAYVTFIGGKIFYEPIIPNTSKDELIAWENYDEGILHFKGEPGPYDKPDKP